MPLDRREISKLLLRLFLYHIWILDDLKGLFGLISGIYQVLYINCLRKFGDDFDIKIEDSLDTPHFR